MFNNKSFGVLFIWIACMVFVDLKVVNDRQDSKENPNAESERSVLLDQVRQRCPLCDTSVYSYCSDKLFHDSCCCSDPQNPYYPLPRECRFADCNFLHANSCQEHKLISACCCISHLATFYKK